jgi:mercuric ion binding protein
MKQIIFSILIFAVLSCVSQQVDAQSKKIQTDTMTVYGSCGQCKTRIEEASYLKGVKQSTWNKKTKILTVIYNPQKTTLTKIATSISNAGHDNTMLLANDKNYNKLPSCCAYRTGTCDHD